MEFTEYQYEHQDLKDLQNKIQNIENRLAAAEDYSQFLQAFKDLDQLNKDFRSNETIASIRHTVDTRDPYYDQEDSYYNEIIPVLQEDFLKAKDTVLHSPFAEELKKDVPQTWFQLAEMEKKTFSPEIIEDLQKENKLANEYQSLVASAQIELDGNTYTLAGLGALMNDKDRNIREKAHKAYWQWFADHEQEIGEIYDQMVKLRTAMARKLGFENYIPLGYLRMNRMDYDQNDVANYRKQILEDIVPLDEALYERQRKRLGFDTLHVWDEKVEFNTGSPSPKYPAEELVQKAKEMYEALSEETGRYFDFMVEHRCMDLEAKPGKAAGGYCTFIPKYKSPFIFSNFSGTADDIETLTHEAGHAFQCWCSQDIFPAESMWPTMESCEIHSMSMEFFTYPWMHKFFEEETDKYYYNHLSGAVKFLPYGVLVDHFQHEVYAHPEMSPKERMDTWRRLEKRYLPHKNYEEIDFLERGGWWMRQLHIFMDPFYYIDYTLAQVCALQFWNRMQKNDETAFEDYKKICRIGGTLPFKQFVQAAGLKSPFSDGCLKETSQAVKEWFDRQDDSKY